MRIIRFADLVETPWKNGGGITRTIAADTRGEATLWRLSMADVAEGGPFSSFAGLMRVLTVIDGTGMVLHGPDGDLAADFARPVTFDGATSITASLGAGPVRDLNLMYDPAAVSAEVVVLDGAGDGREPGTPDLGFVLCIRGAVELPEGKSLAPGDSVLLEGALPALRLGQDAIALTIRLRFNPEAG